MDFKSLVICKICKLLLSSGPVLLPCSHAVCGEHCTAKQGTIRCLECDEDFDVPSDGFPPHKMASTMLVSECYLTDEEKQLKHSSEATIQHLEELLFNLKQKHSELELISFDHFSEVRRQIDLQREEFKNNIDHIALQTINKVNEIEKLCNSETRQPFLDAALVDMKENRQIWANTFRNLTHFATEVQ